MKQEILAFARMLIGWLLPIRWEKLQTHANAQIAVRKVHNLLVPQRYDLSIWSRDEPERYQVESSGLTFQVVLPSRLLHDTPEGDAFTMPVYISGEVKALGHGSEIKIFVRGSYPIIAYHGFMFSLSLLLLGHSLWANDSALNDALVLAVIFLCTHFPFLFIFKLTSDKTILDLKAVFGVN